MLKKDTALQISQTDKLLTNHFDFLMLSDHFDLLMVIIH